MDFITATDRATGARITLEDLAEAAGVTGNSVRRARMDPDNPGYRTPPEGWEKVLAKLLEQRAKEMQKLAARLRRTKGGR